MSPTAASLSAREIARLLGQPEPTAEQVAVIEAPLAPALVVAGAGSGKTETMSARVVYLVANGLVEPRQILGLTFTRKAAHELSERIDKRLRHLAGAMRNAGLPAPASLASTASALVGQGPRVATYNGFALDIVHEHALRIGVDPEFTVLTPAASWQLAYDLVDTWPRPLPFTQSSASIASAVVSLSSSLADHLVTPAEFGQYVRDIAVSTMNLPLQEEGGRKKTAPPAVKKLWSVLEERAALVDLLEAFARTKRERGTIDFSDQGLLAARIVSESSFVRSALRSAHRVVLLDEFQDTSVGQLRLLSEAFGNGHATCAVGDPHQAIYGWRGASAASLSAFVGEFGADDAPVTQYTLSTSWRNDHLLLDVANALGEPLREASAAVTVPQLHAGPAAGPGSVDTAWANTEEDEARDIARWISDEREQASADPTQKPVTAAVLVRSRRLMPILAKALEAQGIPAVVVGAGGLVHLPEIADIRALLQVTDDSHRGDWLMRLMTGARFRLGPRDIAVLGEWRKNRARLASAAPGGDPSLEVTLADAVDTLPPRDWQDSTSRGLSREGRARLKDLAECLRDMRRHASLPVADLVSHAVTVLGVDLALLADPSREAATALANVEQFRQHAHAYTRDNPNASLGAFLAFLDVALEREAGLAAVDTRMIPPDAVVITTVHASKGLEWDIVAVAGLSESTFPSYAKNRATTVSEATGYPVPKDPGWLAEVSLASIPVDLRGDSDILEELRWGEAETQVELSDLITEFQVASGAEKLAEERRLMYVAITRGRHKARLAGSSWKAGAPSALQPSRFLEESRQVEGVRDLPAPDGVTETNPLTDSPATARWPEPPNTRERIVKDALRAVRARAKEEPSDLLHDASRAADSALAHAAGRAVEEADATLEASRLRDLRDATEHVIAMHRQVSEQRDVPLPLRLSPSDLVALAGDEEARLREIVRPVPRQPSASARLGTRFHEWIENVAVERPLVDAEGFLPLWDDAADNAASAAELDDLREKFARSRFAALTPLAVEVPVALTLDAAYMPGVIDAVYPDPDRPGGILIVDWKTGRVPSGRALRAKALQLSVYRLAWHQATDLPLENIRTMFHYVAAEKTVEITEHLDAGDLAAMLR